ncbi:MAG TPA: glycoside hydrolase family 78 protein [Candidatus Polarisedimenticolia bacterium]|nr:glycoside hydrolase family 78 protein [Candidatus Polarisedimenticolia bacterium]
MNLKPIIAAWVIAVVLASAGAGRAQTPLAVKNLRCEYQADPVGIDVRKPRLSWQLESSERGVAQTSYEVRVAGSEEQLAKGKPIWGSGKQTSDASIQMEYGGPALESGKVYYWQVRVADNHGHLTAWSKTAHWEMGLLEPVDWKAKWITPNLEEDEAKSNPATMLRREFSVKKKVERARLYATAMGLYEMELNGNRVGDEYFTPGWTSYDFRYQYQTYDVTGLLKNGTNCLGAMLGDGWFRGRIAWGGKRNSYGKKLALLTQLVIRYTDGTQEIVGTDENWKASTGPILESDIYNGETYDARLEKTGWKEAGCDDKAWKSVSVVDAPKAKVVAQAGPAVKEIEEIQPAKILKTPAGDTVIDMGQNMVGWMRFRVNAPAGTTITLRHAEVLDSAGNFYTENLRSAQEKIRYTTKGQGPEIYQPHFTFQGFRYVAVSGWPGEVKQEDFTGVVVHSAMARTGTFESSSSLLNQLQHNIIWGQKGNFVDVPTDCPQRDERLGWTGDAQVFAGTASFNHDTAGFYTKWLKDVALDQEDDGAVPFVIPNVLSHETRKGEAASAGWADVAVILPWTVYQAYGDKRILEEQYTSMKAWVEYMRRQAGESYLWKSGSSFGDWLAFATTRADYPGATTDKDLIQTAYFAHSTALLAKTAKVLGKTEDAAEYESLEEKIKRAFQEEYVTSKGRLSSNTQTAYALALAFELLPETMRPEAAARLAADVKKFGHLTTGFLGTPALCQALSDYGYLDEAYLLLNRKEYPSWLYPVTKGATTIWERWDGTKPDGSFQNPSMNSFNHYAYGAIGDWMYRVVAGIEIDEKQPGYKHILIQPRPGGGLTYAKASVETPYGHVESGWKLADGKMALHVEVPPNTTTTLRLPKAKLEQVTEGGKALAGRADLLGVRQAGDDVIVEVGSGKYEFESALPGGK